MLLADELQKTPRERDVSGERNEERLKMVAPIGRRDSSLLRRDLRRSDRSSLVLLVLRRL